jgi:hypothetical protein
MTLLTTLLSRSPQIADFSTAALFLALKSRTAALV